MYDKFGNAGEYAGGHPGEEGGGFGGFNPFGGGGGFNPFGGGFSQGAGGQDPFEALFRGMGFNPEHGESSQGSNIQVNLGLTFEEAAFGTTKEISYNVNSTCDTCSGTGAKPGTQATKCRQCNGSGYVIFFFFLFLFSSSLK